VPKWAGLGPDWLPTNNVTHRNVTRNPIFSDYFKEQKLNKQNNKSVINTFF
jgi:hypothetical protein